MALFDLQWPLRSYFIYKNMRLLMLKFVESFIKICSQMNVLESFTVSQFFVRYRRTLVLIKERIIEVNLVIFIL